MTAFQAVGPQRCNTPEITHIFKGTSRRVLAGRPEWKQKVEITRVKIREINKCQITENLNDMIRSAAFI